MRPYFHRRASGRKGWAVQTATGEAKCPTCGSPPPSGRSRCTTWCSTARNLLPAVGFERCRSGQIRPDDPRELAALPQLASLAATARDFELGRTDGLLGATAGLDGQQVPISPTDAMKPSTRSSPVRELWGATAYPRRRRLSWWPLCGPSPTDHAGSSGLPRGKRYWTEPGTGWLGGWPSQTRRRRAASGKLIANSARNPAANGATSTAPAPDRRYSRVIRGFMKAIMACTPSTGPGSNNRNAHCHPSQPATAEVNRIETIVNRKPRQV